MENEKKKSWFEEHKEQIKKEAVRVGYYCLGFAVGAITLRKLTIWQIASGIMEFHNDGIIKFFDPSKGIEIGVYEATKLLDNKK